jgi:hypothetical protein
MQQRLTFSLHGVVAFLLIVLMLASEYVRQLNTTWGPVGFFIFLYAFSVLFISVSRNSIQEASTQPYGQRRAMTGGSMYEFNLFRGLLGCHIACLFVLISLWLIFREDDLVASFFGEALAGLLIPFLLFQRGNAGNYIDVNLHGLVSLVLICCMFLAAFFLAWNIVWWYFVVAVMGYALVVALTTYLQDATNIRSDLTLLRFLLGCHLAFVFLLVGVVLHFKDNGIYGIYLLASVAGGIAIPFLLLRTKP